MTLRICNECGWAHAAQSRATLERQAREFGEFIAKQSPKTQASYGYGPESPGQRAWSFDAHVNSLMKCFRCGNPHDNFHDRTESDLVPMGCTIQQILYDASPVPSPPDQA